MASTKNSAPAPASLGGQECPICHKKSLTLSEHEQDIPHFGLTFFFTMSCSECGYHKADVEAAEAKEPCKYTFTVESEEDLKARVVRSSTATIKIPRITTITPGPASNGYITNIEGILSRVKRQIEVARDSEEEKEDRKKAKNLLKKLQRIMWGQESIAITIEDPSGNSAIISEKAVRSRL